MALILIVCTIASGLTLAVYFLDRINKRFTSIILLVSVSLVYPVFLFGHFYPILALHILTTSVITAGGILFLHPKTLTQ